MFDNEVVVPQIIPADSAEQIEQVRKLFREYALIRDVAPCVQDFEREVTSLPGAYSPPDGRLFLAVEDGQKNAEELAGCVALRKFTEDSCEMKRLYVRPAFRGRGVGRMLV